MVYFKAYPIIKKISKQIYKIVSKHQDNLNLFTASQIHYIISIYSVKDGLDQN